MTKASPNEEVRLYLSQKVIGANEDVFVWWYNNAKTFPRLDKIAMKYLIVPATSAPSERVFFDGRISLGFTSNTLEGRSSRHVNFPQ